MNRGTDDTQAMTTAACRDNSYRLEVSGWDARENFFVEKTSLDWHEREGKTVALHATARLDSVLFVRLIAATNRDLRAEVLAGRFREDLFHRLSSIELRVPGLAERPGDIPILVQHFVKKYGETYGKPFQGLTRRAHIVLQQHDWPGNVHELDNVIASAAITANSDFIDVGDLPEHLQRSHRHTASAATVWTPLPLDEVRSVHMQRVLEMCNGNRVRTAQMLGIGRTRLYRFLKRSDKPVALAARRSAGRS